MSDWPFVDGRLFAIGMRVVRVGDSPYLGMKGTVVGHDLNERNRGPNNPNPLRYNIVTFDPLPGWHTKNLSQKTWVEGHAGIVPLDAVSLLGNLGESDGQEG